MEDLVATSLRRLRVFLVVCDTLHLGKAAERLGIAQPALSQQIRGLEQGLGVRLFNRRKRGIDLTAAGEAYRDEAVKLLHLHAEAAEEARRVARGEMGTLAIGYVASAMFEDCFPAALATLHAALPDLRVTLREDSIAGLAKALADGAFDVVLIRAPVLLPTGCDLIVCARQRLVVVLPDAHRLASRANLSMAELAAEPMIGFNDREDCGIMKVAADLALASGHELTISWRVSAMTGVIGLAAAGQGFGLVPDSTARINLPGVRFVPLRDQEAVAELWYVWRRERVSSALRQFLNEVRAV